MAEFRCGLRAITGLLLCEATRDEAPLEPGEYHVKAPDDLARRCVILVDPMLATVDSDAAALDRPKARGARRLRVSDLVAAADERRDESGDMVRGPGDAGDPLFGTHRSPSLRWTHTGRSPNVRRSPGRRAFPAGCRHPLPKPRSRAHVGDRPASLRRLALRA